MRWYNSVRRLETLRIPLPPLSLQIYQLDPAALVSDTIPATESSNFAIEHTVSDSQLNQYSDLLILL